MSIAVSAVIAPSRLLRQALAVHALACAGASACLLSSHGGNFLHPQWLAAACALGAALAGRAALGMRDGASVRRIDISGLGEMRLTVQHSIGAAPTPARSEPSCSVQLMPGSTIWPAALLLLVREARNGPVTVLTILPGCVTPDEFRRIAVAVRAIARRDKHFSKNNKII